MLDETIGEKDDRTVAERKAYRVRLWSKNGEAAGREEKGSG